MKTCVKRRAVDSDPHSFYLLDVDPGDKFEEKTLKMQEHWYR